MSKEFSNLQIDDEVFEVKDKKARTNIASLENKVNSLANGTPLPATSISEMIDTSKIYVNTTDGKWYYYNNTEWVAGGVYQATQIVKNSITPDKLYKDEYEDVENINAVPTNRMLGYWGGYKYQDDKMMIDFSAGEDTLRYAQLISLEHVEKIVSYFPYGNTSLWGRAWQPCYEDLTIDADMLITYDKIIDGTAKFTTFNNETKEITIDVKALKEEYKYTHILIAYYNHNSQWDLYTNVYSKYTYSLDDFKWLDKKNDIEIVLPSKIFCVKNREFNIYYQNMLKGSFLKNIQRMGFESSIHGYTQGITYPERFRWKPINECNIARTINLYQNNQNEYVSKDIKLVCVPEDTGNNTRKVLIIGDSKINNGKIVYDFIHNFDNDNMSIELLGTRETWNNKHEGRGGWTAKNYCEDATVSQTTNSFYNSETSSFDFSYYMQKNGYSEVDYVFICLGTNDVNETSKEFLGYIKQMVDSIHNYNSSINILIGLNESIYMGELKEFSKHNIYFNFRKALIEEYDNKEDENIYLVPLYLCLDLYEDYNFNVVSLTARDEINSTNKTTKECTDYVHQNDVGNGKCADVMYYTLKYVEDKKVN